MSPRSILICLLICLYSLIQGQHIDSIYSYSELNDYLTEARKENNYKKLALTYYLLAQYEDENFSKSDLSFEYYTYAKQYYEVEKDTLMTYIVDLAIADRYTETGFYQEAIDIYEKASTYFKDKEDISNLAKIHFKLSNVYEEQGDNEKRLAALNEAIRLNDQMNDTLLLLSILQEKVKSYESLNDLDSALITSKDMYRIGKKYGNDEKTSQGLYHVGRIYKLKSDYLSSIRFLEESQKRISNKSYDEHRMRLYRLLSEGYFNIDNYKKAYDYAERYASLNDSILTKKSIQSSNNLALKYQRNEKNSNIKLLEIEKEYAENRSNQQRRLVYLLSIGMVLLLSLLYFIVNFYRQKMDSESIINKQNKEISEQKIRELEDNLKIKSMHSMLEGQEIERERVAKDLHDSLGGLLSAIKLQFDLVNEKAHQLEDVKEYHSAIDMIDSAVDEVRSISQNLQPGSLMKLGLIPALKDLFNKFDGEAYPDIDFQHYNVPVKMDNMIALSIYRIIQELLYNSIKHAQASEILIQINKEEDELIIQFEDDGIGYDPDNLRHKGMGLENINSRMLFLKGEMTVDSRPDEGTSVIIHVRYQ